jgi:integrase
MSAGKRSSASPTRGPQRQSTAISAALRMPVGATRTRAISAARCARSGRIDHSQTNDFQSRNHRLPSIALARSLRQALRALYQFLDDVDLLTDQDGTLIKNPLRNLDVPLAAAPHREHLAGEAAAKLLAAANTPPQKIVLNLLRWTGLRAGEAVALSDEDVDLERREIRVRTSKRHADAARSPCCRSSKSPCGNGAPTAASMA